MSFYQVCSRFVSAAGESLSALVTVKDNCLSDESALVSDTKNCLSSFNATAVAVGNCVDATVNIASHKQDVSARHDSCDQSVEVATRALNSGVTWLQAQAQGVVNCAFKKDDSDSTLLYFVVGLTLAATVGTGLYCCYKKYKASEGQKPEGCAAGLNIFSLPWRHHAAASTPTSASTAKQPLLDANVTV